MSTEKIIMQYNECKTCGAKGGRAALLINDECENCHGTRTYGAITVNIFLNRTPEELQKTFDILTDRQNLNH